MIYGLLHVRSSSHYIFLFLHFLLELMQKNLMSYAFGNVGLVERLVQAIPFDSLKKGR